MTAPVQAEEIAQAVRQVLDAAVPVLRGKAAFEARVASRLLQTLERELVHCDAARQAECARLRAMLPHVGGDEAPEVLRGRLCDAIAAGRLGLGDPLLVAHLWQTALAQLAIDSPAYRWRASPEIGA